MAATADPLGLDLLASMQSREGMRVLLIEPPELFLRGEGVTRQVAPLGLGYVGAAVRDIADVRLLLPDTRAYVGREPWVELARVIAQERPDVVGLTCVTATYAVARRVAEVVRSVALDALIVLGGVHPSTLPEASLDGAPAVDVVVVGEGEGAFRELVLARQHGRSTFEDIRGLVVRDPEGRARRTAERPLIADLDRLAPPMRDGLVWPDDIQPAFYQSIVTLRGCPYRCIYCAVPSLDSSRTRFRSPENVVEEIAWLQAQHGLSYLFFHDSVFTLNKRRTLAICAAMAARGLRVPFCIQTRADRIDAELMQAMCDVGLHQVFFGIESGDVDSLRQIRKEMSLERISEAVALVKAFGVRCSGFFMVGWPWEDADAVARTIAFAISLPLDGVSLFSATPLPGTELWELSKTSQLPESIDFRTPQINLTRMSDSEYSAAFTAASVQVDAFNQRRMHEALALAHAPVATNWQALADVSA